MSDTERAGAHPVARPVIRPGFAIDPEKCTECERCMAACALVKSGKIRLREARITIERRWPETPLLHVCRFDGCPGQPCIESCPVEAIANRDGWVLIDREACNGCAACVEACSYQAIRLDEEERAFKCDYCGGSPACIPECATFALKAASGESGVSGPAASGAGGAQ